MTAAAAVVGRLVRIDARSPLPWFVAAAGALAAALVAGGRPVPALGCGVLLGVAALGGLLRESAIADLMSFRTVARLAWPLLGAMVGLGASLAGGADAAGAMGGVAAMMAGCGVAWGLAWAARQPRVLRGMRAVPPTASQHMVGRTWIDGVAMLSTVVAMAVCFFLAPELAGWYAGLAGAWFTLLAMPVATLAGGDGAARRSLLGASFGGPRLPGTASRGVALLAAYAAVLVWPAAVAWLVGRGREVPAAASLAAIATVGGLLAVSLIAVTIAARCRWRDDAPLAAVAAMHALALAALARAT